MTMPTFFVQTQFSRRDDSADTIRVNVNDFFSLRTLSLLRKASAPDEGDDDDESSDDLELRLSLRDILSERHVTLTENRRNKTNVD